MRTIDRLDDERGAATVEFAAILVPLMVLVLGIISYGYMLSFRQAISQAAAEGARAAAVTPAGLPNADREARALDAVDRAVGYGVTCASPGMTCTVVIDDTCGLHGCAFVELDYDYGNFPLIAAVGSLIPMPDHLVYEAAAEVS